MGLIIKIVIFGISCYFQLLKTKVIAIFRAFLVHCSYTVRKFNEFNAIQSFLFLYQLRSYNQIVLFNLIG